ncbi:MULTISPECIES: helix-turn-helix transcriptional regulator [Enterobacterales]|jgi:transcriptional regulator with XRE-family HTH domain|uniref:Helix-turn-helix n=1 Tax=Candidatus Pantoea symbiotica TaxID=1884370 RepID=A0A1I3USB8_9GAMM|nr:MULTISPECIES: helix-turn-helix transcriptional regulator [Enterobacterales]MRS19925.1 helix-turn-helix domain-containing protein [Enterobacteriaceae bacterium RIT692]MRT24820.1 helix-turn-helix domain-containing protein [Enterobacteriaceae bacterium RIT697]MRT41345.1 helix-turn-helix domain-containing protein [Enterobacteriaceae bacterium RIT702]KAJ9431662.1 helix-turn-helix transcriptional regulator [Pantoea sp. YR343]MBB3306261.1 transcriptional regulator with XRE-family HTH domain [Enter
MKSTSSLQLTFQRRLKQARLAKGLSQKGLGIAAGIDEFVASTRINRYENGIHQVDLDTAQRLADVLEIPAAYFYAEDDALAEIIRTHKSN